MAAPQEGITFVIPVRHPSNSANWNDLRKNLAQTIRSITAQNSPNWNAIIVANHEANLPPLPDKFEVSRVNFPPNPLHEQGKADKESFYQAVRLDKGRRLLAGILHGTPREYIMTVDDDDFISSELAEFAGRNHGKNGWYVRDGYVWPSGGYFVYVQSAFSHFCGTSHIVRADLYQLPGRFENASEHYISQMLGSHLFIADFLKSSGTPLEPLPFRGAVYRTHHVGSHSKSRGVLRGLILKKKNLINPLSLVKAVTCLRFLTSGIRETFGMP